MHSRYDTLKSAVTRVLFGRMRTASERWTLFRSHAFYCMPGIEGAHEEGGVEGERPVPPQPPRPAAQHRDSG